MRLLAIVLACLIPASVEAVTVIDPVAPPPGLAPGTVYQRVFVTAGSFSVSGSHAYPPRSSIGGLAGADYHITLEAFQSDVAGGWTFDWSDAWGQSPSTLPFHAILSDSTTNAKDRLTISGPIYNMANELIANDAADLWDGSIAHAVRYDEFGTQVPVGTRAWTGTISSGIRNAVANCGDWFNPTEPGLYGNPLSTSGAWVNTGNMDGNNNARLYALSPPLIVPPEGDFNHDYTVDAADYVVWRKTGGSATNYDLWRAHYGESLPSGGASVENASVPEPTSLLLLGIGAISLFGYRRKKS